MGSYLKAVATVAATSYRVLIAGCSYSGLSAAVNLLEQCDKIESPVPLDIIIVDERDGFYHLIGSPLALAAKEYSEKAWVEFKDIKVLQRPNVQFVQGNLGKVDPESKTATISERGNQTPRQEKYDYFIAATGLRRVWPVVPQSLSRKLYLMEAGKHINAVTSSTAPVLVVGGGAVGIEMAAELKVTHPHVNVTLAHSRDKLLSSEPLPDSAKKCAGDLVVGSGVELLLNHRLADSKVVKDEAGRDVYEVEFTNGHRMVASEVVMAISRSIPSTAFLPQEALNEEGLVNVRPTMQFPDNVPNATSHFASGDVINWSGIKRCGAAMHEGKLAALNIYQLMQQQLLGKEPEFNRLAEIPPMIGLAVGKTALSCGPEGMSHGPQVMKLFFEDDLGFRICWDHLRLGGIKA
ncbi:hypothetical protein DL766_004235 [Monosporascus sp. MC13-8B]|uniref:FAD/NAD(P)-binding domain-containing protein n=1 Tax=Monosporascus cannonballus TaxID=155416 RepID=A0ABY0HF79_9PEZI|nr:hypothetical protein DL763_010547 [Monosporascus cannonballus]RYO92077.1 hypothetical protein DL762_001812 [Monosporascus cannonballus]RYP31856.1 hypothetical protein DL766_004235 [Monosporascus sp. MC13-8B]